MQIGGQLVQGGHEVLMLKAGGLRLHMDDDTPRKFGVLQHAHGLQKRRVLRKHGIQPVVEWAGDEQPDASEGQQQDHDNFQATERLHSFTGVLAERTLTFQISEGRAWFSTVLVKAMEVLSPERSVICIRSR